MAKPIITLNGLKIVIMLGMLVIILTGVRFAADIIVPFILALFIAVILTRWYSAWCGYAFPACWRSRCSSALSSLSWCYWWPISGHR